MTMDIKNHDIIGEVTAAIMEIEPQEIKLLEFLANHESELDPEGQQTVRDMVKRCIELLGNHTARWNAIIEAKAEGHFRYLDEKPYRIALLRLKGAILQAKNACGDLVDLPF